MREEVCEASQKLKSAINFKLLEKNQMTNTVSHSIEDEGSKQMLSLLLSMIEQFEDVKILKPGEILKMP